MLSFPLGVVSRGIRAGWPRGTETGPPGEEVAAVAGDAPVLRGTAVPARRCTALRGVAGGCAPRLLPGRNAAVPEAAADVFLLACSPRHSPNCIKTASRLLQKQEQGAAGRPKTRTAKGT